MKKKLLGLFFSLAVMGVSAQTPLNEIASDLFDHITTDSNGKSTIKIDDNLLAELKDLYGVNGNTVAYLLNKDPFLKDNITFSYVGTGQQANVLLTTGGDTGPSGLNVTSVVNAVADLMITRAKEELTLAFFNRLQAFSNKYPEFQTLFPKTFDAIRKLPTYSYPQMLPELRTAFVEDLDRLTYNLEAVFELPQYQTLIKQLPEIGMAVQTLKIYHDLENGVTPEKVLTEVKDAATGILGSIAIDKQPIVFKNLVTTVQFADMLSQSLRDGGTSTIWITAEKMKKLITDDHMTELYLGLLWQQVNQMGLTYYIVDKQDSKHNANSSASELPVQKLMSDQAGNLLFWQNKLSQFLALTAKVENAYAQIDRKPATEKVTADEYYNFIATSIDAIDFSLTVVKAFDKHLQADDYLAVARDANNLYKDIYSKQYTQAVSDGLDIISSIELLTATDKKNQPMMEMSDDQQKTVGTLSGFVTKVKPFALFIANVAEAKNENDIEAALNNAILPVGSSSVKKNTANNLSIQSYLGINFSFYNFTPNAVRAWSDKVGLAGPIGLSYTPGCFSWDEGGSLSVFASAFDLGAIIDYKLKQDPTATTSTTTTSASTMTKQYSVNLGQLFSPGVSLVYGFFDHLPLSLGIGAQYGPGLTNINAAGVTNVINPSWRFNVFLAVDLPFFNLVNQQKSK